MINSWERMVMEMVVKRLLQSLWLLNLGVGGREVTQDT